MNKSLTSLAWLIVIAIALCSCGRDDREYNYQYIPYQSSVDGDWGMIAPNGHVLVESRFKHMPLPATDGRFWVPNEHGYYELYNCDERPQTVVDKEYRWVSLFHGGRAFVAERDKPMSVINTDGKQLVDLSTIGEYTPDVLFNIQEGAAVFAVDTLQGMVNDHGDMIVPARYHQVGPMSSGKVVATTSYYTMVSDYLYDHFDDANLEEFTMGVEKDTTYVFDAKGRLMFALDAKTYPMVNANFYGKYLPVAKVINGKLAWGLVDENGVEVLTPRESLRTIHDMRNDVLIYSDTTMNCGVMDLQGNMLIPARYQLLQFATDQLLIATEINDSVGWSTSAWLMTFDGTQVGGKYDDIDPFYPAVYMYGAVQEGEHSWNFINAEGAILPDCPKICNIMQYLPYLSVASDSINIPEFVKELGISPDGVCDLTFSTQPKSALDIMMRYSGYSQDNKPAASDYTTMSSVFLSNLVQGEFVEVLANYPQSLSNRTYTQREVIDYVDYYYGRYWYHMEKVPTGYQFRTMTPTNFEVNIGNQGKFRGKLRKLYDALVQYLKGMGTLDEEGSNSVLFTLNNGKRAIVTMNDHTVSVKWGKLGNDDTIYRNTGMKENLNYEEGAELYP